MNRDNILFTVIGLLLGFISGYVAHEVMAARQPPPLRLGAPAPGSQAQAAIPQTPEAPEGAMAAMEQVQRLRAHVEENPEDREALQALANLNYDISNWSRAAELYERYLALEPQDFGVLTDLGATYRNMGDLDRALSRFQEARKINPQHWQALFNEILVVAIDQNQPGSVTTLLEELERLNPDSPDVQRLAAEVKRRAGGL